MTDTIVGAIIGATASLITAIIMMVGQHFLQNKQEVIRQKDLTKKLASGLIAELEHIIQFCENALISWDKNRAVSNLPFSKPYYSGQIPLPRRAIYDSNISLLTFFSESDMRKMMSYYQSIEDAFRMYSEYCAYVALVNQQPHLSTQETASYLNSFWQGIWDRLRTMKKEFEDTIKPSMIKYT